MRVPCSSGGAPQGSPEMEELKPWVGGARTPTLLDGWMRE